jgi:hypothetical protein
MKKSDEERDEVGEKEWKKVSGSMMVYYFELGRKCEEQLGRRRERKNTVQWGTEMNRLNVWIYHNFQQHSLLLTFWEACLIQNLCYEAHNHFVPPWTLYTNCDSPRTPPCG